MGTRHAAEMASRRAGGAAGPAEMAALAGMVGGLERTWTMMGGGGGGDDGSSSAAGCRDGGAAPAAMDAAAGWSIGSSPSSLPRTSPASAAACWFLTFSTVRRTRVSRDSNPFSSLSSRSCVPTTRLGRTAGWKVSLHDSIRS